MSISYNYKIIFVFIIFLYASCKNNFDKEEYLDNVFKKVDKPLVKFPLIDLDCSKQDSLYLSIYLKDQDVRINGLEDYEIIDQQNLQLFVSLVEECGFPHDENFTDFRSYSGIFVVLQHNDAEWIAYYYKDFKKLIENGKLPLSVLALLEDRFLLLNNQPQLYGTQIKDGKLYKVINPLELKQRRKNMNFNESIEDYLYGYFLNYDEEIQRMMSEDDES